MLLAIGAAAGVALRRNSWLVCFVRRRASRVCIAWRCFFYGTLTWRRSSS